MDDLFKQTSEPQTEPATLGAVSAAAPAPRYIFAGQLSRSYYILPSGRPYLDVPGGNVIQAAVGLAVWEPAPPPGLVARVGEDYPQEWLEAFKQRGFDTRGIRVLPEA